MQYTVDFQLKWHFGRLLALPILINVNQIQFYDLHSNKDPHNKTEKNQKMSTAKVNEVIDSLWCSSNYLDKHCSILSCQRILKIVEINQCKLPNWCRQRWVSDALKFAWTQPWHLEGSEKTVQWYQQLLRRVTLKTREFLYYSSSIILGNLSLLLSLQIFIGSFNSVNDI